MFICILYIQIYMKFLESTGQWFIFNEVPVVHSQISRSRMLLHSIFFKNLPWKGWIYLPAGIYLLKVNNKNTRTRCEICSELTIKIPGIFIVNFEHVIAGWVDIIQLNILAAGSSFTENGFYSWYFKNFV